MRSIRSALYPRAMLSRMTLAAFFLAACSPAAPQALPSTNPASPAAAAGTVPALVVSAPAPDAGTGYVCPMHPEVTSHEPGSCPKCHMKLVPQS